MELSQMLTEMVDRGASDLHLKVGRAPSYRVCGDLKFAEMENLNLEDMAQLFKQALDENQRIEFERSKEVDFALSMPGLGRFRGNIFMQRGSLGMVFRHIPTEVPNLPDLSLPDVIDTFTEKSRGLVLVTGMTGSGKSTTLAAMVKRILEKRPVSIMTIEDPVEFLHLDGCGMITQREVGGDTVSFSTALKHVLRQDPDVLVIGEIRDAATMRVALTAADTGHLVLSTLHTTDAVQTINRMLSLFPPDQHTEIRYLIAHNLSGIISMRLVQSTDEQSRVPATEILVGCSTVREYMQDPKQMARIKDFMVEGTTVYGTRTFDMSLYELCKSETISLDEALKHATHPDEIRLKMTGIEGAENLLQPMDMTSSPIVGQQKTENDIFEPIDPFQT
ncbi:MAG: PilT/PilU family type 4a pilus ATPase [bacterium]|nr:PilT/PilU family type 4a pilus ATPase [bacterium]